jgi:hypothetical protein
MPSSPPLESSPRCLLDQCFGFRFGQQRYRGLFLVTSALAATPWPRLLSWQSYRPDCLPEPCGAGPTARRPDAGSPAHRVGIIRSKSGHRDILPLEARVEHALSRYVRDARPPSDQAALFLTVRAPFRPLSASALYDVVASHMPITDRPWRGRGPHGLRHACARHLIEAGLSFKEVGDHLGHRSPDSTRIYAKVHVAALRLVAFEDFGGLL